MTLRGRRAVVVADAAQFDRHDAVRDGDRSATYLVTRNVRDARHSGAVIFNRRTDDPAAFPIV